MIRQTSIDCYNQIRAEGLLSKRRWEVYDIVFKRGPMTSNETFDYSSLKGVDGYRHNANARMTELRDSGVVQEIGTTICSKTGRTVILWDVTDKLPTKAESPLEPVTISPQDAEKLLNKRQKRFVYKILQEQSHKARERELESMIDRMHNTADDTHISHEADIDEAIEIMKSMKLAYAIYPEKIKAFIKKHHKE